MLNKIAAPRTSEVRICACGHSVDDHGEKSTACYAKVSTSGYRLCDCRAFAQRTNDAPARLDPEGTAKPLTEIVAVMPNVADPARANGRTIHAGQATHYIARSTEKRLAALQEIIGVCAPDPGGVYDRERQLWEVEQIARAALNGKPIIPYPGPRVDNAPSVAAADLDRLEKLMAAATPMPWCHGPQADENSSWLWEGTHHHSGDPDAPDTRFGSVQSSDAVLIVAMREALPGLIAEARRARATATDYPRGDGWDRKSVLEYLAGRGETGVAEWLRRTMPEARTANPESNPATPKDPRSRATR